MAGLATSDAAGPEDLGHRALPRERSASVAYDFGRRLGYETSNCAQLSWLPRL